MIQHKDKIPIDYTDNPLIFLEICRHFISYFDVYYTLGHWHGYHCVTSPFNNTWKVSRNWGHQEFDHTHTQVFCPVSETDSGWCEDFALHCQSLLDGALIDIPLCVGVMFFTWGVLLTGHTFCFGETWGPQTGQSTLTLLHTKVRLLYLVPWALIDPTTIKDAASWTWHCKKPGWSFFSLAWRTQCPWFHTSLKCGQRPQHTFQHCTRAERNDTWGRRYKRLMAP